MTDNIIPFSSGRHNQAGYFALADLPQRESIEAHALDTGWWELDQIFKVYPGQFVVTTGLAGSGKSTFLLNLICNMAQRHKAGAFLYVPENEGHIRRKLELIWGSRPDFDGFCNNHCFIQSAAPENYQDAAHTLDWILDMAVASITKDGTDLLLIDPWNEIERAKPRDMLMTDYIGQCLMWLKQFCRAYDVAVFLVAHPTKAGIEKGKIPSLADIEGSMNWFNKCDNGLIVHRPDNGTECQVISAKVREIGAGKRGVCHFMVDAATGLFTPQPGAVSL
jgi:twinkle protein